MSGLCVDWVACGSCNTFRRLSDVEHTDTLVGIEVNAEVLVFNCDSCRNEGYSVKIRRPWAANRTGQKEVH